MRRAGVLGDGYHVHSGHARGPGRRIPVIRAAAEAAGRPMPGLSGRVAVSSLGADASGGGHGWDAAAAVRAVRAYEDLGLAHLALVFDETEPAGLAAAIERFDREVVRAVSA